VKGEIMIRTIREWLIHKKYSKRDKNGKVHCSECPLKASDNPIDFRCKAVAHYDKKQKEWIFDDRRLRYDND
jgi:hypothetical protein